MKIQVIFLLLFSFSQLLMASGSLIPPPPIVHADEIDCSVEENKQKDECQEDEEDEDE